jgi:hypothetical protein
MNYFDKIGREQESEERTSSDNMVARKRNKEERKKSR